MCGCPRCEAERERNVRAAYLHRRLNELLREDDPDWVTLFNLGEILEEIVESHE